MATYVYGAVWVWCAGGWLGFRGLLSIDDYLGCTSSRLPKEEISTYDLNMGRLENGLEVICEMLQQGEEVLATVLAAKCDPPTGKVGKYSGALAITGSRLLFSGRYLAAKSQSSHQLSQVSSLNLNKSAMVAHIQIMLAGSFENYLVKFRDAELFMSTAQNVLADAHKTVSQLPAQGTNSKADEILKLAELHKMGILSDDEFAKAKASLLNS